jgi:transposase
MRGNTEIQITMLSSVTADQLVPEDHPIRQIKPIVDNALRELSPTFRRMYAETGRPSIPPEHLLKSCLLIDLYSVRSERQFCERLQYDLLFKWFLDLNITDPG